MGHGRAYLKFEDRFIQSSNLPLGHIATYLGRTYASVAMRIQSLQRRGVKIVPKMRISDVVT